MILKKFRRLYMAQLVQSVVIPSGYLILMPIVIYATKEHQDIWEEQKLDYRRLWFDFEIDFFFISLFSIVIYL